MSSAEELATVQALIQSEGLGIRNVEWVDSPDAEEESMWRSSAGENSTFLRWNDKEPNGGTSEKCLFHRRQTVIELPLPALKYEVQFKIRCLY